MVYGTQTGSAEPDVTLYVVVSTHISVVLVISPAKIYCYGQVSMSAVVLSYVLPIPR